jgi:outer membrane immunogenic protein
MRWRAGAIAFVLCNLSGFAQAADQALPPAAAGRYEPAYFPQAVNWTGFYVGLNVGGGFASAPWTDPRPGDGLRDNPRGAYVIGGGQLGANWQIDSLVMGFEFDFDGQDLSNTVIDGAGDKRLLRSSWLSTLTGRAGYAFGQALFYAKGGVAFGNERNDLTAGGTALPATTSTTTQIGWTVGAGVEYGFTHSWSAKLEYDFVDFPSNLTLQGFALGAPGVPGSAPVNVNFTIQRLIAGINYHF